MQVAETYVQRLLHSTDALAAVHDLAAMWSARPNRSEAQRFFGLAEPEFHVHLCLTYVGEVVNGGHAQFFMNPFGRYATEVVTALRVVGLPELSSILEEAAAVFADPAGQSAKLRSADTAFDRESGNTHEMCLAYLRAHDAEILRPERS